MSRFGPRTNSTAQPAAAGRPARRAARRSRAPGGPGRAPAPARPAPPVRCPAADLDPAGWAAPCYSRRRGTRRRPGPHTRAAPPVGRPASVPAPGGRWRRERISATRASRSPPLWGRGRRVPWRAASRRLQQPRVETVQAPLGLRVRPRSQPHPPPPDPWPRPRPRACAADRRARARDPGHPFEGPGSPRCLYARRLLGGTPSRRRAARGNTKTRAAATNRSPKVFGYRIEHCENRLKQCRAVATPYEKAAAAYLDLVTLAALRLWLSR